MKPKIHQRESDGRFVILDQNDTPFWWATFETSEDANAAWKAYQDNLYDAALYAHHNPDVS